MTADPHALLDDALSEVVRRITDGAADQPRPGQRTLSHAVLDAMLNATSVGVGSGFQTVGNAPTGSGKSAAYLTPAFLVAMTRAERAVVSTESLSLQAQIVDKDAPLIAAAVHHVISESSPDAAAVPNAAVLKGWSNYVCSATTFAHAAELIGLDPEQVGAGDRATLARGLDALIEHVEVAGAKPRPGALALIQRYAKTGADRPKPKSSRARAGAVARSTPNVELSGQSVPLLDVAKLLAWALGSDRDTVLDKHAAPMPVADTWPAVSISKQACPAGDSCPLWDACSPDAARNRAAEADVIVTNHTMLAIQAAHQVPLVTGSKRLGVVDHLVIDEAHALPGEIRKAGAASLSAWRIARLNSAIGKLVADTPELRHLSDDAGALALLVDAQLDQMTAGKRPGDTVPIAEDSDPTAGFAEPLIRWVQAASKLVPAPSGLPPREATRARSLTASLNELADQAKAMAKLPTGYARWLERGNARGPFVGSALKCSPVDVAFPARDGLFTADCLPAGSDGHPGPNGRDDQASPSGPGENTDPSAWLIPEHRWVSPPAGNIPPRYALSVTAVSATLPVGFEMEMGLSARAVNYPSPFDVAYAGSRLFVPRVTSQDVDSIAATTYGKRRFDTAKHALWAAQVITELVLANGGSALILASTSASGRLYADQLRAAVGAARCGIDVFSQWDGATPASLLARWRADHGSVMVGTRSLMTGVDAPGETNTLVVIDRVPRSPSNPVDDARVKAIMDRAQLDRWAADRLVYGSDAALLLRQATGRLIRSASDTGMVAVLDPRLLKTCPLRYPEPTRNLYLAGTEAFGGRTADRESAAQWLRDRRSKNAGAR